MKIETLNERIQKAEEKAAKKQNTIEKKQKAVAKKLKELFDRFGIDYEGRDFARMHMNDLRAIGLSEEECHEAYWLMCDIDSLNDDLKRLPKEIAETQKTVENYKKQLDGEIKRQSMFVHEVPETLKKMQEELVAGWDESDKRRRDTMIKDDRELSYEDLMKKWTYQQLEFRFWTDEQIHESNMRDAETLVINLINRVKAITGEITSWDGITCTRGSHGCPALNGFVVGKEGRCEVESIGAGGWNIQRYHIRVLVKAF